MCRSAADSDQVGPVRLELADLLRQFAEELTGLTSEQASAIGKIARCRTAELGGHVHVCDQCGHVEIAYNSCRDRHCPKCQSLDQARWLAARQADLLPVEYFHVVFTIPSSLRPVFGRNKRACYNLLFSAVSATMKEVALNPERLGARIGFTAVLHTWSQKLGFHPHLHCVVPGGGPSLDGTRWISSRPGFFLPIRVLGNVFRGKLLSKLERAWSRGELNVSAGVPPHWLEQAAQKKWVVYSKAPFAGPKQVLAYLGQYTHRTALSNQRLVRLEGRTVTFKWRDRADGNKSKLLSLDVVAFLRRFVAHVLPKRLRRIRHYGFLANSVRRKAVARCRGLLAAEGRTDADPSDSSPAGETWQELLQRLTGIDVTCCPVCKTGHLVFRERIPSPWEQGAGETLSGPTAWALQGRATSP